MLSIAELPSAELHRRLTAEGVRLRTGPMVYCIRSALPEVRNGLSALYGDYPVVEPGGFADFHISVDRVAGLRRWIRPQLSFRIDGDSPFTPLPVHQGLPMLEWGMNWCMTGICQQFLILHAAVLERHGRALVMPAPSGSGKSTLCAALVFRGWRLLSDELALIDLHSGKLVPMPRPVSLKNASIEVIQRFAGERVRFGSVVHDTMKGRVGHFAAPLDAIRRADEQALPGWVVFPRFSAGAETTINPLLKGRTLMRLVENAFNYNVHRAGGFNALADLAERSDCIETTYGHLDDVVQQIERLAALNRSCDEAA